VSVAAVTPHSRADAFRHEALLYAGMDEFLDGSLAFVRDGIEAGEPTLVVVDAYKIDALRAGLGRDARAVRFADMAAVGHNPARIIPAWHDFVTEHGLHGYLRDKHATLLSTIEKNGAKWDNKPAKDSDSDEKKAFKKTCIDAEAELTSAIEAFKKTFA